MRYWLLKTEPSSFSVDDLAAAPGKRTFWDGVRNYQARNLLRDDFANGDQAFLYHSSSDATGIAGIVEVVGAAYPDPTAFDPGHHHYDPKSDPAAPIWFGVDVKLRRKLPRIVTLTELKSYRALAGMQLLKRGNRLSVQPVAAAEWRAILALVDGPKPSSIRMPVAPRRR
jgi:predicted RNA-binding protein with PUA-like domain